MILQNRKGFDQLFLQQGGLCVGLGEELYEYADYTGIVREIIAELRKRLQVRHLEKEQSQGWNKSFFNGSPWLTSMISSLGGPLNSFLLLFTFGPCILNIMVNIIRDCVNKQLLVLRSQYQLLELETLYTEIP